MRIAISGASGMIGTVLVPYLRDRGHDVVQLVRREPQGPSEVRWDPAAQDLDEAALGQIDGWVHLSGANVGDKRWTDSYKAEMRTSRIDSTQFVVSVLGQLKHKPSAFVCGSAIGYYGDRGEESLTEESGPGQGFLAQLVVDWEVEAAKASALGVRTTMARTGLVMWPKGGAFGPILMTAKLGVSGPLGSGRQWWSWISMLDECRAIEHLLLTDSLSGPVNLTAPEPGRQAELTKAIAKRLHRPSFLPVPAAFLRLAAGELAEDIVASARILPHALHESGFTFTHPQVSDGITWLLKQ